MQLSSVWNNPNCQNYSNLHIQIKKTHNTYKGLIGISPSGSVTFISDQYPGNISDKELTRQSGLVELLEGDSIMVDRGFDIGDIVNVKGVRVSIPPFLRGKKQLEASELVEMRSIASLRIHVERCIRIITFLIEPPWLTFATKFFTFAVLTNFYPPLCT